MTLFGDKNLFIRNIVDIIKKGKELNMGTIYNSTLYVLVNYGILYTVDLSSFIEPSIICSFDDYTYLEGKTEELVYDKNGNKVPITVEDPVMGKVVTGYKTKETYEYLLDKVEVLNSIVPKIESIMVYESPDNLVYHNTNLKEDESFEEIINSKSDDGAFKFFIPLDNHTTFIYVYKSLFGMNKSDKASVKIFKTPINNRYVANFDIYKAKLKLNMNVHILFLDMN